LSRHSSIIMSEYKITLTFKDEDVSALNKDNQQVCFGASIKEAPNIYTLVAWSGQVANEVTITWKEEYAIAASNADVEGINGPYVVSNTFPATIRPKQAYDLRDWFKPEVISDPLLDEGSIYLINESPTKARAVLQKSINGMSRAFYLSTRPIKRGEQERMTPRLVGAVWLEKDMDQGVRISKSTESVTEFDMTNVTTGTATWDGHKLVKPTPQEQLFKVLPDANIGKRPGPFGHP